MTNLIKENQSSKEQQLLDFILSRPDAKNSPENVLSAIEEFSESTPLRIVGRQKGKYILDAIHEKEPTIMIELGCYVGHSAILFGAEFAKQNERLSKMQNEPAKYYSFEINPDYAVLARQIVDLAGLSDTVEIIVGAAGNMIPAFQERLQDHFGRFTPADFVFLNHAKELYVPDLRVMESSSLIAPDTMIFADNIFISASQVMLIMFREAPNTDVIIMRESETSAIVNVGVDGIYFTSLRSYSLRTRGPRLKMQ